MSEKSKRAPKRNVDESKRHLKRSNEKIKRDLRRKAEKKYLSNKRIEGWEFQHISSMEIKKKILAGNKLNVLEELDDKGEFVRVTKEVMKGYLEKNMSPLDEESKRLISEYLKKNY